MWNKFVFSFFYLIINGLRVVAILREKKEVQK